MKMITKAIIMVELKDVLEENPIVAAVKNMEQLDKALKADVNVIFVLLGDILNLDEISENIYISYLIISTKFWCFFSLNQ